MEIVNSDDRESIVKWLTKQTVFVTGGTGFLGKALLFKLLQSRVKRIFVLIRPKKGKPAQERLDSILKEEIFASLISNDGEIMKRLTAIAGDVTELGYGLSEKDRSLLQNETTIVYNCAASVKFDDPLKLAIKTNLRSTREIIQLAKGMKNLKMFHHVSTAYSNSDNMCSSTGIKEEVYEKKIDCKKLIEFVETTPDDVIATITEKVLGASVNTYIFTKHLAESIIQDAAQEIPVMISRPPIIIGSLNEPLPGWIDNISSPVAIIAAAGKGVLRVYFGTGSAIKAYMPVDICINCIISSTWREMVIRPDHGNKVAVYNMEFNSITTNHIHETCKVLNNMTPVHNAIWHLHFYTINSCFMFLLLHLLLHVLPGLFFDGMLRLSGQKPRLTRLYRKLYTALLSLIPFMNLDDKFKTDNYLALKNDLPEKEKKNFRLDLLPVGGNHFLNYMKNGSTGFRKLVGDPPLPSEKDFIHLNRLYWLDKAFLTSCGLLFFWLAPYNLLLYPLSYVSSSIVDFYNSI